MKQLKLFEETDHFKREALLEQFYQLSIEDQRWFLEQAINS